MRNVQKNRTCSTHMRNIVNKANSRAIAIHRSFISHYVTLLVRAYKTYMTNLRLRVTMLSGLQLLLVTLK